MGFWRAVLGTGSTPGPGPAAGDAGAEAAGPYAALLPDGEQPEEETEQGIQDRRLIPGTPPRVDFSYAKS